MENMPTENGVDFSAIAENSPDPVFVVTGDNGNIVYCNSQTEALSGFPADELLSRRFVEFLHPQEHTKLLQNYQHRLEGKPIPERYETRVVAKDGRIMPVEVKAQKISWNNQLADFITLKDISDLKWLESFVQNHAEVLDTLGENVTVTDRDGAVVFTSKKTIRSMGIREDEILGHNVTEFFLPEFRDTFAEIFKRVISGAAWQGEVPVRFPDGRIMPGWVYASPLLNDKRKILGSITVAVDIKERKQLEEELQTQGQMPDNSIEGIAADASGKTHVSEPAGQLNEMAGATVPDATDYLQQIQGRFDEVKAQLGKIGEALSGSARAKNLLSQETIEKPETNTGQRKKEAAATGKKRLEIYCLGTLKVCSSERQVRDWPGKRARAVFEYLVSKPKIPVPKDALMETLWPGSDPTSAANNLRMAVYGLRQTLNRLMDAFIRFPSVLFSQGGYLLNPEFELVIDTEEFERYFAQGRRLEKEGKTDAAMQIYRRAEELYRGDYLEDELYEDWTLNRRETLKDTYLLILNKLADHAMNKADYESCILYCQKTLARDPCREDVCCRLMCCYSRLGQRNRAIQWYKTCRQTVKAELHTSLDRKTIDLYNRLLNGEEI